MTFEQIPQDPAPPKVSGEECAKIINGVKQRRTTALMAALGLVVITGGATAGLVYAVILKDSTQALTTLATIATLGIGGLLALAGAKHSGGE